MFDKKLLELWLKIENKDFVGWDFTYLNGRTKEEKLPWKYRNIIDEYLKQTDKLLDMGTGGGEFLLTLNHPYQNTSVTEAWEPNVNLCFEKLSPLGIEVKQVYDDELLPFEDNCFDIIINRHENYNVEEVKRILKDGGIFITQQVGGKNNYSLSNKLIEDFQPMYPNLNLEMEKQKFISENFEIIYSNEFFPWLRFYDMEALIYFVKIIEWEFPGFSVESNFEQLKCLHNAMLNIGYVESIEHRFMIIAKNNK